MANAAATDAAKGANEVRTRHEKFEIVSMHGTVEYDPTKDRVTRHIHLALSDKNGACWGGHVMSKGESGGPTDELRLLPIYTTAEVTLLVQVRIVQAWSAPASDTNPNPNPNPKPNPDPDPDPNPNANPDPAA